MVLSMATCGSRQGPALKTCFLPIIEFKILAREYTYFFCTFQKVLLGRQAHPDLERTLCQEGLSPLWKVHVP